MRSPASSSLSPRCDGRVRPSTGDDARRAGRSGVKTDGCLLYHDGEP